MLLYQNIGIYKWWKLSLILGNCHFVIIFIIKDNILTPRMLLPLAFNLKKIILNPMQQNVLYFPNNDITESPHVHTWPRWTLVQVGEVQHQLPLDLKHDIQIKLWFFAAAKSNQASQREARTYYWVFLLYFHYAAK